MSPVLIGVIGVVALFVMMFAGMPLGFALIVAGFGGYIAVSGFDSAFYSLGMISFSTLANFNMVALPLFMLMSMVAVESRISGDLYRAGYNWFGHIRGGLAMATAVASTLFGAISSDEISTASAMGKAAFPEMKKYNYRESLAASCIAAGGTIATLIPPSASFIIYGILTEQSIGRLFLAGVLPGLLQTVVYISTIYLLCLRDPELGPAGPKTSFREKVVSLKGGGPILLLFGLVMGGIYLGIFTATEAGAIGAFGAFVIGFCMKRLSRQGVISSFLETGRIIAMVGVLIVGANVFASFITVTRITFILADFITGLQVSPWVVLAGVLVFYFICGFFLSVISVLFLTLPLIFPLITALGFDPIWFGVLIVVMIEMGTITPPVAQVCFVLSGVIKVPIGTIFRGILPFILADILVLIILIAFPQVSLWLPTTMKG